MELSARPLGSLVIAPAGRGESADAIIAPVAGGAAAEGDAAPPTHLVEPGAETCASMPCERSDSRVVEGLVLGLMSSEEISRVTALGDEEERSSKQKPTAEHARACGAGRSSGLGPNGAWEHVQVVTPEMANKLVLNRGAVFTKYSFKQGKGGIRSKSERLVWLSGDNRIMWKDATGAMPASAAGATPIDTAAPSLRKASSLAAWCGTAGAEGTPSAGSSVASMAVADVVSISTTPPAHYGGENTRSLYIVSKARSLMLEAEDTEERDFWYDQLSAIIHVEQIRHRERRRQAKFAQRDDDVSARCQLFDVGRHQTPPTHTRALLAECAHETSQPSVASIDRQRATKNTGAVPHFSFARPVSWERAGRRWWWCACGGRGAAGRPRLTAVRAGPLQAAPCSRSPAEVLRAGA